jgi:hypothetical protein
MRRRLSAWGIGFLIQLLAISALAGQDKLVGRWEGTVQAPQGERPTTAVFEKEGEVYTGRMPGMRPNTEIQLKDVKIEGDKVTAKAEVETPQSTAVIHYTFKLEGEVMSGQGNLDFGGQSFTFEINLKRVSQETRGALATPAAPGPGPQRPRNPPVPQPVQQQSPDYFVGQWSYRFVGRESALGPAPRDCTVNFAKRPDGKSLASLTECRHEGGTSRDSAVIVFDEATKILTFTEKLGSGVTLNSRADWTSPISIRFTVDPVKVKGQSLQLRRTLAIVSAHSFTVTEELSEDGGPFVRLGNAVVTKVGAQ